MKIKPVGPRITVRPQKIEESDATYASAARAGIVIPDLDERKREQSAVDVGTVLAVSHLAWSDVGDCKPWCKVGDKILYAKYGGKSQKDEATGETVVILNDEDVLAVFDNEGSA